MTDTHSHERAGASHSPSVGSLPHQTPIDSPHSARIKLSPARSVYVVDDEILIADSVAEILIRSGYETRAFYDGRDAIDCARVDCPDVLVSDVFMPHMNGVQLAIAVRKLCATTRILLFSGQAATCDILRDARTSGYNFELLAKPIHPRDLLKVLAS